MSSKQSTTPAPARKPRNADFKLVYGTSKKPTTRHLDERCWSTTTYREASPDEMKVLPICKHCQRRAARDAAKVAES